MIELFIRIYAHQLGYLTSAGNKYVFPEETLSVILCAINAQQVLQGFLFIFFF